MGNSNSNQLNINAFRFEIVENMVYCDKQITITKLDKKSIDNIEININKYNSNFTNLQKYIVKILNVLNHYIMNETTHNLGQIDAFNFVINKKLRLQIINLSAKHNQNIGGVNTKYYYIKVCDLSKT